MDQYGCVNVNGIPLQTGSYNVDVVLVATHSLSSLAGTETVSFSLPFEVLPDTTISNNAGFSMIEVRVVRLFRFHLQIIMPGMFLIFGILEMEQQVV